MTLKIALAGAGLAGQQHAAAVGECEGVVLAAVVDPNPQVKNYAESLQAAYYESLAALFDNKNNEKPDGIILATPNHLHVENGLQCVEAGCAVLVEKPLAVSAAEGQVLARAAAAAGVPCLVGHHRRHSALAQQARAIIDSGRLGKLRMAQATCWLYKPDDYFDNAAWRKQQGAGPVAVNLVHDIDLIRYFCGDVASVQAQAVPSMRGHENEDAAAVILRFANDALATLTVADAVVAPWSWELTAQENPVYPATAQNCYWLGGSHAALSLPDLTVWENNGTRSWWQPLNKVSHPPQPSAPLLAQVKHFAAIIRGEALPLVSAEEGVKNLQVLEAIQQSIASNAMVRL